MRVATMYAFLERAPVIIGKALVDVSRIASKEELIRYRADIERAIPLLKVIAAHCEASIEGKYGILVQVMVDECGYLRIYAHHDLDLRSIDHLVKSLEDEHAKAEDRIRELEKELTDEEERVVVEYYGYAKVQSMLMSLISEEEKRV